MSNTNDVFPGESLPQAIIVCKWLSAHDGFQDWSLHLGNLSTEKGAPLTSFFFSVISILYGIYTGWCAAKGIQEFRSAAKESSADNAGPV